MASNITEEEIEKLKATNTESEWNTVCDEIKAARGGEYPADWWAKVKQSGLLDEAVRRFGGGGLHVAAYRKSYN